MNCRKASNLLSSYIDGELPGVEQLQIRSHLKNCPSCGAEHESLLRTKRVLATLAYRAPRPGFDDDIIQFVGSESANNKSRFNAETWWTLLTESQRNRMRFATVTSLFAIAGILWATRVPMMRERDTKTIAQLPRTVPSAFVPVPVNVRDLMTVHGAGTEGMSMSAGPDQTPSSANLKAELAALRIGP